MPKYNYVLSDKSGRQSEGIITASDKKTALRKLRKKNKIIISVAEKKYGKIWWLGKPNLSLQEKIMFAKQLGTMIKVGISIIEALRILADQSRKRSIKTMYEDIIERIGAGQSLAKSLRKYNYIFPDLFINMIETGEEAGNLEKVLDYLTEQLEKEYEIRRKIIAAFIYPAIIIGITILMSIGIVIFIMPRITKIFKSFEIDLPLLTRILITLSEFLTQKPLWAALIALGAAAFFTVLFKLKVLKPFWHRIIINLPIFGNILIAANLARFSRTINSLLQSGMPITDSLRITADMLNNNLYKKAISNAADKVEQGGRLGESFEESEKLFPPLVTKMLFIGEKSGTLENTADNIAKLYESFVDSKTKNLSVILEPILLLFMAILVGGIAISIILPIYQLPALLGTR